MTLPPVGLTHFLVFGAILFSMGLFAVMVRRHAIAVLLGIELMLNAANINLIAVSRYLSPVGDGLAIGGQVFALIVMTLAACEVAVGLAIVICVYRNRGIINPDEASDMRW